MSLPKYIINFEELTEDLKNHLLSLIDDNIRTNYPEINTNNIQDLLQQLKDLLPSVQYEGLKKKIDTFICRKIEGIQKVKGVLLDIPAIQNNYTEQFKFDKGVYITGLHFNQTGWKKEDKYSLEINKIKIIANATTKEIGEHKYFNTFYKVNANTPISFVFHNLSGNSRQIIVDLEYIDGEDSNIPIEPPGIEDIDNEWDIAVVMNWEENTDADIDLHGKIDDKKVWYGNKSYDGFYLNFDYTSHKTNKNPEIISVKGYKNRKLHISIRNFNGVELKEPVTLEIYKYRPYGNKLLKKFNVNLDTNRDLKEIFIMDLNTLKITNLNK
ncbi:hypothetical protein CF060_07485 [Clostridium botulinum]|uniref:hypothetical protein n=1 Tax=Clostridium botulinum TaxID=1491 RepID=UPI0009477536|nr:hypothetical protein [Clostridium botulinum]APQ75402.1 hypothetical protein RSJ10_3123 [Clostridium botulinum]AUN00296.1 hypothetical protein RSJ13_15275 [Clostridium botulinum]MBN3345693.1 hypothetical protein [Clostridium botulinum]MBN3354346.1 hypothetical protein [Clostridium botulinum]QDY30114.1 hypothetical protein CGQ41_15360 [Clostridium botulinum]